MKRGFDRFEQSRRRASRSGLEGLIQKLSKGEARKGATAAAIEGRRRSLLDQYGDAEAANRRLERILKGNDLIDASYLMRGVNAARSVCRVVIKSQGQLLGYGTGFLVAPGVILTNEHVLSSEAEVASSVVQFDYERDMRGGDKRPVEFALRAAPAPIIEKELDFTLAAVSPLSPGGRRLEEFGWLRLNPQPCKAFIGEYLTIIQHPGGEMKQVCVRENKLLKYDENGPFVWYQTDTTGGSSGSPAFNNDWDVVALHHSAVPRTKKIRGKDVWIARNGEPWTSEMGDDSVDWIANEGVRISRILAFLQMAHGSNPLAAAVLGAASPPVHESFEGGWDGQVRSVVGDDGLIRVRLPIEIGVRMNVGALGGGVGAAGGAGTPGIPGATGGVGSDGKAGSGAAAAMFATPTVIEKVEIDQSNYPKRTGYQENFLGKEAKYKVPLPQVVKDGGALLKLGGKAELKYWTYSVLFNRKRRLAYVSAANVDPQRWRGVRDAEGDTWYNDSRVDKVDPAMQVGRAFYKKQKTFEADRTSNPFDQGHLTRRRDVQWGDTDPLAKRNGDDSYHYTNCAPQHWAFNQNNKDNGLWFRLEETAAAASDKGRLCIFNGPIFDAPLCSGSNGGRLKLDPAGKRPKDGTFGGVQIPRQFFKIFAYRKGDRLRSAAFIVTQENLLATIDRYYPAEAAKGAVLTDLEVKLYQVPVLTVAKLAGLDFGALADGDAGGGAGPHELLIDADGSPLESLEEARW